MLPVRNPMGLLTTKLRDDIVNMEYDEEDADEQSQELRIRFSL